MSGYIGPSPLTQATYDQKTFTGITDTNVLLMYVVGFLEVYKNGVLLVSSSANPEDYDYSAVDGISIEFTEPLEVDDIVTCISFKTFESLDSYTKRALDDMIRGSIQLFAMNSAPLGWLKANGAEVSRINYADLFERIGITYGAGDGSTTFNLPDVRGQFLRCLDDDKGIDTARTIGSLQGDSNKSHSHGASSDIQGNHTHSTPLSDGGFFGYAGGGGIPGTNTPRGADGTTSTAGAHSHNISIAADGGSETRPVNMALLGCIKY